MFVHNRRIWIAVAATNGPDSLIARSQSVLVRLN